MTRFDAVLCPGQGAQKPGMGRAAAEAFPEARAVHEAADEVLGFELTKVLWEGSAEEVNRTDICQPGIYVVGAAALAVAEARGLLDRKSLRFAAGLSLGEYTALHFAGALGFEDGLELVRERGLAMQAASDAEPSGMASIMRLPLEQVERCCAEAAGLGVIQVANLLSPEQIVISGAVPALERAVELCQEAGARRVTRLGVAGAFHSELMRPAADRLVDALERVEIREPSIPVVTNVSGTALTRTDEIRDALAAQVVNPVLGEKSMRTILDAGATTFAEPGPGRVLSGLMRKIERSATVVGFDDPADFASGNGDES
jgi:[acyl-carrier-protein] S-malonyltransferase